MNPTPTNDPANDADLKALWRDETHVPDTDRLVASVHSSVRLQRRFLWASHAFGLLVLAYIGWLDLQGVFELRWMMTALVGGSIALTVWKAHLARKRCPDLASLAPIELLRLALRHARAGLRNARMCHTLLPLSVLFGMAVGPLLVVEGADAGEPTWITALWVAGALGFVAGFVVYGHWLARRKKQEIAELERRLREFENSV